MIYSLIFSALFFLYLTPKQAYACGSTFFPAGYWMVYTMSAFLIFHTFFLYLLNKNIPLAKPNIVKNYSQLSLHLHLTLPIIITFIFIFSSIAYACLDPRSPQEKFIDNLLTPYILAVNLLLIISVFFYTKINSGRMTEINKRQLSNIIAIFFCIVTFTTLTYLSHAIWIVAPTLSDMSPYLNLLR